MSLDPNLHRSYSEAEERALAVAEHRAPRPGIAQFIRLILDPRFAYRVIGKRIGLKVPLDVEDRRVLEQVIFPTLARHAGVRTVLFVGCDWYTKHYEHDFFSHTEYWTIEPDPVHRKFGARQHVSAPLEKLSAHFPPAKFDLIICNGVYGWGLNTLEQCEAAFAQCHERLRPGGLFVLGWDAIPARDPAPLAQVRSLERFTPWTFAALGGSCYETDTPYRHTYAFYQRAGQDKAQQ